MLTSSRAPLAVQVEDVVKDHQSFNELVYSTPAQAREELARRASDPALAQYLQEILPKGVPGALQGRRSAVLFRHIATSNYETRYFVNLARTLEIGDPLILEYEQDQFNDRNQAKYFLGKLRFYKGVDKRGKAITESVRVIDFNASGTAPISSLKTLWGEALTSFHHRLFAALYPELAGSVADISEWLLAFGAHATDYYKPFFSLFLRDNVLFEDFCLNDAELSFTKKVVLPAFLSIYEETGVKPLIVKLTPTDTEEDLFWYAHPADEKALVGKAKDNYI